MSTVTDTEARPYTPPTITAVHAKDWPDVSFDATYNHSGWALRIALNTRNGQLTAIPNLRADRTDRSRGAPHYDPSSDLWIQAWQWDHTPTWIAWELRTAYGGHWGLTIDGVNAMLDRLAPTAQTLLDNLAPIPGTNGHWDWTLAATAAHERIDRLFGYPHHQIGDDPTHPRWGDIDAPLPERHHYGVVTFTELINAVPEMIDPTWATMSDDELDAVAAGFTGSATVHSRFLPFSARDKVRAGVFADDPHSASQPVYIIGARTGLRTWRNEAIAARTGLPPVDVAQLNLVPEKLTADINDQDLQRLADELEATYAHEHKMALVGTLGDLRRLRAAMRAATRTEARTVGERIAAAEAELRNLRALRAGYVGRIVSWRETPEWENGEPNYAEVGRLVNMTRQGARQLVETISGAEDNPDQK